MKPARFEAVAPADSPVERSQLVIARYWKPFASLVSLAAAGLAAFPYVGRYLSVTPDEIPGHEWPWALRLGLLGAGLLVFGFVRSPRTAALVTRVILGAPRAASEIGFIFRGPRPYGEADALPDRRADLEECWLKIQERPLFVLEGESGCGKSSLLNAALVPRARGRFTVVHVRAGDDPVGRLHAALVGRRPPGAAPVGPKELSAVIEAHAAGMVRPGDGPDVQPKPTLVCVDQSEELFTSVAEGTRRDFAAVLHRAVADGHLRLLVVIRSDFRDLLDKLFRTVDPELATFDLTNDFVLRPFPRALAEEVLGELLRPVHGDDPLLREQIESFSRNLVQELLRPPRDRRLYRGDEKTVLPVELQIVGYVIQRLGSRHFTRSGLAALGGKAGLFRRYVDDVTRDVMRMTGVGPDPTLAILRILAPEGPSRAPARNVEEIARAGGLPVSLALKVLDVLSDHYIVNRLPDAPDSGGPGGGGAGRYELMHDHLAVILAETPNRRVQRAREAEERLRFWTERSEAAERLRGAGSARRLIARVRGLFAQQVPFLETVRLWRWARADERRMLLRNARAFALKVAVFLLVPTAAGWAFTFTDEAQIQMMIGDAPVALAADVFPFPDDEGRLVNLAVGWVRALGDAGRHDEAVAAAGRIRPGPVRWDAVVAVAESLVRSGRHDDALATARAMVAREPVDPAHRQEWVARRLGGARALAGVARALDDAGRQDLARQAIQEAVALVRAVPVGPVSDPWVRAIAHADAARVMAVAGEAGPARRAAEEALAGAREVKDSFLRLAILGALVRPLIEARLEDLARQTLAEIAAATPGVAIGDPLQRAGYLSGRTRGFADAGQVGDPPPDWPGAVQAQVQRMAGDAAEVIRTVPDEFRSVLLADVAGSLAIAGDLVHAGPMVEEALAVARGLTAPELRGRALGTIAGRLAHPRLADVARRAADEALRVAPEITNPGIRGQVLAVAARRLAYQGQAQPATRAVEESLPLVRYVAQPNEVCELLLDAATAYARLGRVLPARTVLQGCPFVEYRLAGYTTILSAHTWRGRERSWSWWSPRSRGQR
jgi:hypothetical protein